MNFTWTRKVVALVVGLVLIVAGIFVLQDRSGPEEFTATLAMESDALGILNYYYPRRLELNQSAPESGLNLPEFRFGQPAFGSLVLGNSSDSVYTVVLDESPDGSESLIYIDKNNNEDLTDDGDGSWSTEKSLYRMKEVLIDIGYETGDNIPYPVVFYRHNKRLTGSLMVYRNGYRKGRLAVEDTTYKIALFDDDCNGIFERQHSALVIDLNRDGVLSGQTDSGEYFKASAAVAINGQFYRISRISSSGDQVAFVQIDTSATQVALSETNAAAPVFAAKSLAGETIGSEQLQDQVVLIDFWATWCKPWELERENLKRLYERFHSRGLQIVGMNLDYDLGHLQEYLDQHKIIWPQIADGTGWEMRFVSLFNVDAAPRSFLVDRTGAIRFKNLHGKNLEAKVYELLMEAEGEE